MSGASKNAAGRGPYVPKRDGSGQEGVGTSKKGRFRARKGRRVQNRAGRGQRVPKRGRKWSARPKTGQEEVRASKKGRLGWEGVGASKNGAGRARKGRCVQKKDM